MKITKNIFLMIVIGLMGLLAAGCSTSQPSRSYSLAPKGNLPLEIQNSPSPVLLAYRFAIENPETLKEVPCYCGCGGMGHTSNYSCYIAGEKANGELDFDGHALGCSICVDITQDTMRLIEQGKSITEIKLEIDDTYSAFGPSNMP